MGPRAGKTSSKTTKDSPGQMNMETLVHQDLEPFQNKRVLVIGDLILDHYLWGSVERTCYEAPVPVVLHQRDSWVVGAASNVAHNIVALGGKAELVGVVGDDSDGAKFLSLLEDIGVGTGGIVTTDDRCTNVKTRVMSQGQQILRIDHEQTTELPSQICAKLQQAVRRLIKQSDVVIISDYAKGVVDCGLVQIVVEAANQQGIPVLVDPKGRDYRKYQGVDVVKPNDRELGLAVSQTIHNEEDLVQAGRDLMRRCGIKSLVVSRGAEGMAVLKPQQKPFMIAARAREVFDVNGAGDTVLASLSLGLACGLSLEDAAAVANHAAGVVVGKLGVATVSPRELLDAMSAGDGRNKVRTAEDLQILLANLQAKGRKIVFTNGCYDLLHPGHIYFLHAAKKLGDLLVVGLNTDRSVRAVKGSGRPILPEAERAAILSALQVVDYIVFFDELTPESLLEKLHPDILVKGRDIPEDQVVGREIVRAYGGQVKRLPILHSSTASDIIQSILGGAKGKA